MNLPLSDLIAFQRDPLAFFLKRGSSATRSLEKLSMGPFPVYLVTDAELVKPVLKAPESDIDKGQLVYKLRKVIGQNTMTLSGDGHRDRRAILHRQLARGIANSFVPQIEAIMAQVAASIMAEGGVFDAHQITALLTLRIICTVLFGPDALTRGDQSLLIEASQLVEDDLAAEIFWIFPDLPWVRARKKAQLARGRDLMTRVVARARHRASSSSILKALEELELSEEELRDEILLILLAGHHTTGSAAAWLLYHLATDPALREGIAAEAALIVGKGGDTDPSLLPAATLSLAAVRETLRLYPSAWWLSRETMRPIELAGVRLGKGTSLLISPWHMHRDPRFWSEPERFDVSRSHVSPAFLPFGAGPRACVGMGLATLELQLLALAFASAFSFERPQPAQPPKPSITLIPPRIVLRATSASEDHATRRTPIAMLGG